ncbi:FAD binding domain-containing protein [Apiospora saccharicola]
MSPTGFQMFAMVGSAMAAVDGFYTSNERELTPSCVFRPTDTAQVSQFVKFVGQHGQRDKSGAYQPLFAVRGGGHTLWSGAANMDGGITVDMRGMSSLTVSPDHKMVSLGAGGKWSDLYPLLTPYNLTVAGGRVPGIGVAGFALGGGVSFEARRHGWTCDNIYGYEMVLASGEVVYVTSSSHPDLWMALKGGSNNFGIVTRFDVAAFPSTQMWGGTVSYNYTPTVLDAQASAFASFMDPKNFDDAAMMGLILGFANPGGYSISNSLFYLEPTPFPKAYQTFTSIPSTGNTIQTATVADTVNSFGKFLPAHLSRAVELVFSFKNGDAAMYSSLMKIFEDGVKPLANIDGLNIQLLIQPHPVTNGTNSLGLTAGETDLVMLDLTIAYNNDADDAVVEKQLTKVVSQQKQVVKDKGLLIPYTYLNYADKSQQPIDSYGAANKAKLQAVSKKYDAYGLFQKGVRGGYKLF